MNVNPQNNVPKLFMRNVEHYINFSYFNYKNFTTKYL